MGVEHCHLRWYSRKDFVVIINIFCKVYETVKTDRNCIALRYCRELLISKFDFSLSPVRIAG